MKKLIHQIKGIIRHLKAGTMLGALAVLLMTAGIAVFVGVRVHDMQKQLLILQGELNTHEATVEYNRFLLTHYDIVSLVGFTVDDMLQEGADNSVILDFLTDETNDIIETLDPETTGLYGWINDEYIDGSGWKPDADYVATERPWYIGTINSKQDITFVDPYLDAQTNTIMMTVSKLLCDGKSVLAMDVSLAPVQNTLKRVSASTKGGQAFLLDPSGVVIVHSDEKEVGKNYLKETDTLGSMLAQKLFKDGERQFEIKSPSGNYTVYGGELEGGWYSVSLINSDVWYWPLYRAMLTFSAIIGLVVLFFIAVFLKLKAKNAELQELNMRVDLEKKRGVELKALSETDRMTGLMDRVSGERNINELLSAGSEGMFLELDIDHFKSINDTYGHQAGDIVIHALSDALRNTFRSNDVTIRLGGDEFGVFAVGIVNREMGISIVERLFERIDGIEIPELKGEKFAISVGAVISRNEKELNFNELYAAADRALYKSKNISGNSLTFGKI